MARTKSKEKRISTKKNLTRLDNNPHGANQWVADPRQQLFLAYYLDPKSATFSNALQSGLKAKFSQEYSENILKLMPAWLLEKIGNSSLLMKAERNLEEFLELPNETQAMSMYGPVFEKVKVQDGHYKNGKPKFKKVKRPIMQLNPKVMKIKQDSSHFIAERVGKAKYGPRAAEGGNTYIAIFTNEQRIKLAREIIEQGAGVIDGSETPAH